MQERMISILEAVAAAGTPVSVGDLVRLTRLPRPTCYRLVRSLTDCGFLEPADTEGRYQLGMRFVRIALLGKSDAHVRRAMTPIAQGLAKQVSETVFFSRYRGGRVDLVYVETPADPKTAFVYPGLGERPAHACSSAKIIAAFAPPDIRDTLIGEDPEKFTGRTIVSREEILDDLEEARAQGYAICDGEIDDGITSVAVPIDVDRLGTVFSLGVVGPARRIHAVLKDTLVPVLRDRAIQASAAIQHCSILEVEPLAAGA